MKPEKTWYLILLGFINLFVLVFVMAIAQKMIDLSKEIESFEADRSAEIQTVDEHILELPSKITITNVPSAGGQAQSVYCPTQAFDPHTDQWVEFIDKVGPKLQNEYPAMIQFFSYWFAWQNSNANLDQYLPNVNK